MEVDNDFKKFANSKNIPSMDIHQFKNKIEASVSPYILEERKMNVTQMDVFSRLMRDRIVWISGEVNSNMSAILQAQLMYLDSVEKRDIKMHVDTPGGCVKSGLGIVDVMDYVKSDIQTINTGMAASMGSVLLSSGTKGKRSSLINSRVMIHQVSSGQQGNIQDTSISHMESHKYNYILFKMLAKNSDKTFDEMIEISKRDKWFNSDEALKFGLIDEVIGENRISDRLKGFDEYYKKMFVEK